MKRLYLAASIDKTGAAIVRDIEQATGKKASELKAAFISTAAEGSLTPDKTWLANDRDGLSKGGLDLLDYTITDKSLDQIIADLGSCDVIHVNGGNSFYLLLQMKKTGFDKWIKNQVQSGNKIYTSSSAGGVVIAPNIEVMKLPAYKKAANELKDFDGLSLVDFLIFPHWGSDNFKDAYFGHRLKLAYKPENKIVLLNNWQYIEVTDDVYKIKQISK
jgi:dipeptidase E